KKCLYFLVVLCGWLSIHSCKKQTDRLITASLNEYMVLQPGKYIRYQLDSTRFIYFGQKDTTVSYDAKDVIDAEITDNEGRTAYRVIRYLRSLDSNNESDYYPVLTYSITPTGNSMELSENNLRYQKLR